MKQRDDAPGTDPAAAARAARLRYATDRQPGIRRKRAGKGFRYLAPDGAPIRDPEGLARIKALHIPPAYTDVWICADPRGHLQATGRDAKGRKQYRYHPRWRVVRDETKYDHMIAFGEALPRLRARTDEDLARPGLPREKVLAAIVKLLEKTLIRVGNQEYADQNHSYGLTTLRDKHVKVAGTTVHFAFKGKSGVVHERKLTNRHLAQIIKRCRDLPGYDLFQYVDDEGNRQTIDSADVNVYLHAIAGEEFTAKDFRTWAGTVLCAVALNEYAPCDTAADARSNIVAAIRRVAERLGNTPAVCRKAYVHPAVLDAYLDGTMLDTLRQLTEQELTATASALSREEAAVLALLRRQAKIGDRGAGQ
jgi:DNA topoisomerase I